jgi:asparagine synthase (glutamine-hydrolysing)
MTFLASVAAGRESADSLHTLHERQVASGQVRFARHGDLAVVWTTGSSWIDTHDDGTVLVVLDGRLHEVSAGVGHQAELLLERYRATGSEVAKGLLGDFVFIVLDRETRTLLVARDPIGVRPWYQATSGSRLAGASDLATLASLPWVDTAVNEPIAIEHLAARAESRGETIYRGIRTLRPGETWHVVGHQAETFLHHRWNLHPELGISWEDAAERCRLLLDEAVRCRLDVGGPATSELSGGLDSSSVVGTVVKLGRSDLVVGRLVFDGPRADERFYSDAVIDHWGIRAVSSPAWIPSKEEGWELTRRLRRPLPDPNFTMFVGLHRMLLGQGRPDGLTGLGGDDAFIASGIASRVVSTVRLRQGHILKELLRANALRPRAAWPEILRPTLHYLAPWKGDRLPPWLSDQAAARADLPRLFRRRAERVTGVAAIDERIANLTSGYDAWILEVRAVVSDEVGRRESHPFLDPRFIEATYGLDPWWPTRGGHTRALQVEAYGDRLPPAVGRRRSKADFSEVFWPQMLDDETLEQVQTGPLADLGWLDRPGFDALVAYAKEGKANAAIPLFRCVSLDRWLRSR